MRLLPLLVLSCLAACAAPDPVDAPATPVASPVKAASPALPDGPTDGFVPLAAGFEYARLPLPDTRPAGDHLVRVVRLDPSLVDLTVQASSIGDRFPRVASAWAGDAPVVAVINASMFRKDMRTSLGFFRVGDHTQNGAWTRDQSSLLVLDPVDPASPPARLTNLGCADRDALTAQYRTLVQSIRMVGCDRANLWAPDTRRWSAALTGADGRGRLLFLFVRSAYTMQELVDLLLALPLDLVALHYGDGGPPASLFVRAPGFEERNVGSTERRSPGARDNTVEWPLPNVFVATPRDRRPAPGL